MAGGAHLRADLDQLGGDLWGRIRPILLGADGGPHLAPPLQHRPGGHQGSEVLEVAHRLRG